MFNTIILRKGSEILTNKEYKGFTNGDTIWGDNASPEELNRWPVEYKEEAKEILAKLKCTYEHDEAQSRWYITEYALEYCETDEDGEFVEGSDYDF